MIMESKLAAQERRAATRNALAQSQRELEAAVQSGRPAAAGSHAKFRNTLCEAKTADLLDEDFWGHNYGKNDLCDISSHSKTSRTIYVSPFIEHAAVPVYAQMFTLEWYSGGSRQKGTWDLGTQI